MRHFFLCLILFVPLALLSAKDITTKAGKTYHNYSVAGYSAEGLTILHSTGGVLIPLEEWPDDRKEEVRKYINKIKRRRKLIANRPDLKTKSGTVFKKYRILGFNASGARVSHWGGISIVQISDLPDDIQKKYEPQILSLTKPKGIVLKDTLGKRPSNPFPADLERYDTGRHPWKGNSGGTSIEAKAGDTTVTFSGSDKKSSKKKNDKKKDKEKDKDKKKDKDQKKNKEKEKNKDKDKKKDKDKDKDEDEEE